MVEIEVVRKWAKEVYPWMTNEDFLIKLYKKEVLKENFIETRKVYPQFQMIKELKMGMPASLRGKMIEAGNKNLFEVCAVCGRRKKNCDNLSHQGVVSKYALSVDFADEENVIQATIFVNAEDMPKLELDLKDAYEFIVSGKLGTDSRSGEPRFIISTWRALSKEEGEAFNTLYDYFSTHANGEKAIKVDDYHSWLDKVGSYNTISMPAIREMEKYLILKSDVDKVYVNVW